MSEDRERKVDRLLDRLEIVDCMARYTKGVDRHDVELMRSAFWPDAEISYTNVFSGDREAFIEWVNAYHTKALRNHQHHTTVHTVHIEGDVAVVEHYCLALLQQADFSTLLSSGRYLQQYERRDGEWRISVREYMPEMSFTLRGEPRAVGLTPEDLRRLYEGDPSSDVTNTYVPGGWAPFPPSGPPRQDRGDLAFHFPLGRRSERAPWA